MESSPSGARKTKLALMIQPLVARARPAGAVASWRADPERLVLTGLGRDEGTHPARNGRPRASLPSPTVPRPSPPGSGRGNGPHPHGSPQPAGHLRRRRTSRCHTGRSLTSSARMGRGSRGRGYGCIGFARAIGSCSIPGISCGRCPACLEGEESLCVDFRVLGEHRSGTVTEYVVVPADNLARVPERNALGRAAAFSLATLTAWRMLTTRARLAAGETVLIWGIGGGVAMAALQVAVLLGARAIVTSGSDAKLEVAGDKERRRRSTTPTPTCPRRAGAHRRSRRRRRGR